MNNKNLDYYMSLPYPVTIIPHPCEDTGIFYEAYIPLLGKFVFNSGGETVEEAYSSLMLLKEELLQECLDKGVSIPEPEPEEF